MKEFKKFTIEILELEEDIVRTSGISGDGGDGGDGGSGDLDLDDPMNEKDDIISDFGN